MHTDRSHHQSRKFGRNPIGRKEEGCGHKYGHKDDVGFQHGHRFNGNRKHFQTCRVGRCIDGSSLDKVEGEICGGQQCR